MAKSCILQRELKRRRLINKYFNIRRRLKKIILNSYISDNEKWHAQIKLQKLPVNSSLVRFNNRCRITGRAHGVYRKFGLCRHVLREHAMQGNVPGLKKASW